MLEAPRKSRAPSSNICSFTNLIEDFNNLDLSTSSPTVYFAKQTLCCWVMAK